MMRFLVSIIIIVLLASCNDKAAVDNDVATSHVYYYYPKLNVYFDTSIKDFHYFDSSANTWKSGTLPSTWYADLGKSVVINNAVQPVWTDNKQHRLVYSATLYADSSDFKKESPKVATINKSPISTSENDSGAKKKTKVGQWIQKVFGKKKDEQK